MKAKVKATGDIVEVYNSPHYPDTWFGAGFPYSTKELEFIAYRSISVIQSLERFTDWELKIELKRRDRERQSKYPHGVHCRDCKHCGEGYTYKNQFNKVMVCFAKPKPNMGPDRYYATALSYKACDKFKSK